jgi:cytochrome b subunit of formate dehydrogenase
MIDGYASRLNGEVDMQVTAARFTLSERWFHNTVMMTFIILTITGFGMLFFNLKGDWGVARQSIVLIHKYIISFSN